jgi:hypothetical protein
MFKVSRKLWLVQLQLKTTGQGLWAGRLRATGTNYNRDAHWKEMLQRGSIAIFTRPSNPV